MGLACLADIAAMEDEPMVRGGNLLGRDMLDELTLGLEGCFRVVRQADAVGDAEHMGVDRHGGLVEDDGGDDVGGLASHTREPLEVVDIAGHYAAEVAQEPLRHTHQVAALVVGIGYRLDILKNVITAGSSHRFGVGVGAKERRRHHVDTLVGALGRENDGYQQLEGSLVVQLGLRHGHRLLEPGNHLVVSLLFFHHSFSSRATKTG